MISYNVDGSAGPFEVVTPMFEGIIDGCKLLIVYVGGVDPRSSSDAEELCVCVVTCLS